MAANFEKKILFHLVSHQILEKSHRISKNWLKSSKSYGQKPLGVPKDPPGLNRVKTFPVKNLECSANRGGRRSLLKTGKN